MKRERERSWISPFNMVEIVVAMVIIMVLVDIPGVLSSSIRVNADALNRGAAADAGEQFLHFFNARIEFNWVEIEALPDSKPAPGSENLIFSRQDLLGNSRLRIHCETTRFHNKTTVSLITRPQGSACWRSAGMNSSPQPQKQ